MKFYKKAEDAVGAVTRYLAAFCLFVVFLLFLLNICTRLPFITWNPTWIDEIIQFFLVWMIFLGAMELVRTGGHFMVDILTDKLHGTLLGRIFRIVSTLILLFTYGIIFFFGVRLCMTSTMKATYTLPAFVNMAWFYSCIPVTTLFMTIYSVRDVILAIVDLFTGGKVTEKMDAEKAAAALEDEDAKAIAEAAAALKAEEEKGKGEE